MLLEYTPLPENSESGILVSLIVFLSSIIERRHFGNFKTIIAPARTLEVFKKARERAGLWWVVFAGAMIVLAISLIVLAIGLYLFIKGR